MSLLLMILAALAPAVVLVMMMLRRDREHPEPLKWVFASVGFGVISAIIVILLGIVLLPDIATDTYAGAALTAFLSAAIPEEAAKFLLLWIMVRNNRSFDEWFDGIVYAVCVGMGFAGFENIFYVIGSDTWVVTSISRALLAVPAHWLFAVIMGYYFSLGWFIPQQRKRYFALALIVPMIAHGVYDTFCFSLSIDEDLALFILLAFIFLFRKAMTYAKTLIASHLAKDREEEVV